jgi:hypothetical protein
MLRDSLSCVVIMVYLQLQNQPCSSGLVGPLVAEAEVEEEAVSQPSLRAAYAQDPYRVELCSIECAKETGATYRRILSGHLQHLEIQSCALGPVNRPLILSTRLHSSPHKSPSPTSK